MCPRLHNTSSNVFVCHTLTLIIPITLSKFKEAKFYGQWEQLPDCKLIEPYRSPFLCHSPMREMSPTSESVREKEGGGERGRKAKLRKQTDLNVTLACPKFKLISGRNASNTTTN